MGVRVRDWVRLRLFKPLAYALDCHPSHQSRTDSLLSTVQQQGGVRPGGESHMKWTGMLVVSLRGVNFGFWSRLGCS